LGGVEAIGGHSTVGIPSLGWAQCEMPEV